METRLTLPESFTRTIVDVFEDEGVVWLEHLPELLADCERRWSLRVLPATFNLSYNYVTPAVLHDGTPVVLKAGVPNDQLTSEIALLRLYDGRGSVRLLDADVEQGLLLLERLEPGTPLTLVDDDQQAMRSAAQVMRQLWRPAPAEHGLPTVSSWWARSLGRLRVEFGGGCGPFPEPLVALAEQIYATADATTAEPVLLHGDLHQDNILAADDGSWRAIDPHGLVGDRAHEVGSLLYNRLAGVENLRDTLERRLDVLSAELQIERPWLVRCALAKAMLSSWWHYEDHGRGWEPTLQVAEVLAMLR